MDRSHFKELGTLVSEITWNLRRILELDKVIEKYNICFEQEGIDFVDTYSSVTKWAPIRVLITIDAINNLMIIKMNVKTIFLSGDIEERIYLDQSQRIC